MSSFYTNLFYGAEKRKWQLKWLLGWRLNRTHNEQGISDLSKASSRWIKTHESRLVQEPLRIWGFILLPLCPTPNTMVFSVPKSAFPVHHFIGMQNKENVYSSAQEGSHVCPDPPFHLCCSLFASRVSLYCLSYKRTALACRFPTSIFTSIYHL